MDEKTYFKRPQIVPVWSERKYYVLRFQLFVFFLL